MTSETARPDRPIPAAADTPEQAACPTATGTATEGRLELAAHRCFACGELSAHGLRMPLHLEPDAAWSELTLDEAFQGWEGMAHGGILATLLDETMAWATAHREAFGFTARMSIEYRRPVPVGVPLRIEGRVVEARRRVFRTEGRVVDPASGESYATADGVYVRAPEEVTRRMRRRYRFGGRTEAPDGSRRWMVSQTHPALESDEPDPAAGVVPGTPGSAADTLHTAGRLHTAGGLDTAAQAATGTAAPAGSGRAELPGGAAE